MKRTIIIALALITAGLVGAALYAQYAPRPIDETADKQQAAPVGKSLNYANKGLTAVGANVYNQTDAVELDLSYNNLTSLPSQMGAMQKLTVLKLDHNKLRGSLIAEIRKMPLQTLDVSYNDMTGVPAEIGQLKDLKSLNYSYNKITALPNEITKLTQLKSLDLTGNPISADKIASLRAALPNTAIMY
jgi:Leucine-rich repeat (LRR) protein